MHGLSTSLMVFIFIAIFISSFLSLKFVGPRLEKTQPQPLIMSLVVSVASIIVLLVLFQLIGTLF